MDQRTGLLILLSSCSSEHSVMAPKDEGEIATGDDYVDHVGQRAMLIPRQRCWRRHSRSRPREIGKGRSSRWLVDSVMAILDGSSCSPAENLLRKNETTVLRSFVKLWMPNSCSPWRRRNDHCSVWRPNWPVDWFTVRIFWSERSARPGRLVDGIPDRLVSHAIKVLLATTPDPDGMLHPKKKHRVWMIGDETPKMSHNRREF